MTCDHAKNLLIDRLDGTLPPESGALLEAHLAQCGECRDELDALREAEAAVRALPRVSAPADFMDRLRAALDAEDAAAGRAVPAAPAPASAAAGGAPRPARWRFVPKFVSAAAALLVLTGLYFFYEGTLGRRGLPSAPERGVMSVEKAAGAPGARAPSVAKDGPSEGVFRAKSAIEFDDGSLRGAGARAQTVVEAGKAAAPAPEAAAQYAEAIPLKKAPAPAATSGRLAEEERADKAERRKDEADLLAALATAGKAEGPEGEAHSASEDRRSKAGEPPEADLVDGGRRHAVARGAAELAKPAVPALNLMRVRLSDVDVASAGARVAEVLEANEAGNYAVIDSGEGKRAAPALLYVCEVTAGQSTAILDGMAPLGRVEVTPACGPALDAKPLLDAIARLALSQAAERAAGAENDRLAAERAAVQRGLEEQARRAAEIAAENEVRRQEQEKSVGAAQAEAPGGVAQAPAAPVPAAPPAPVPPAVAAEPEHAAAPSAAVALPAGESRKAREAPGLAPGEEARPAEKPAGPPAAEPAAAPAEGTPAPAAGEFERAVAKAAPQAAVEPAPATGSAVEVPARGEAGGESPRLGLGEAARRSAARFSIDEPRETSRVILVIELHGDGDRAASRAAEASREAVPAEAPSPSPAAGAK